MLDFLQSTPLTPTQWTLAILSALLVGISKAGLSSISVITVTTMAWVFGSKTSTGILLPMLIASDILAVLYYKRAVDWGALWRLLPWVIVGILVGVWVGKDLDEAMFKKVMAAIVLVVVVGMFWLEKRPLKHVTESKTFAGIMGIATGFTSMIGNQAGGFATVYFLSMRLAKNNFIGTNAWLFFCVNLFKLPFHIFSWHTIHVSSLSINLVLLPFCFIGFYVGAFIVKKIDEKHYRPLIMWLTALAAVIVFLR